MSQEFNLIKKGRVSPYTLEFASALERTLAYAHTGNVKVLSSAVMKPLFMARAMVELGMPTILKGAYELPMQGVTPFVVNPHAWPLTANKRGPAICSKASHVFHYGEDHYMVSEGIDTANMDTDVEMKHHRHMKQSFGFNMCYTCRTTDLVTRSETPTSENA
jgi:hypothetical protein